MTTPQLSRRLGGSFRVVGFSMMQKGHLTKRQTVSKPLRCRAVPVQEMPAFPETPST
jgi:hypothetical protein